ncbi:DUF817 domain-containing protein [Dyella sp.]|uniref:DUF817 domain-containing protein n=1 Tax=Dyella sp. TaxID=1869338 RepID=UPI002D78CD85|nr:DUF817 domain-containing protein [Dyella sp.]HET7331551.1 DUF817 domain-containing protein [Dyella sp.]
MTEEGQVDVNDMPQSRGDVLRGDERPPRGLLRVALVRWHRVDRSLSAWASRHGRFAVFVHELAWFGIKQAWACLFGGLMLALLMATWMFWPANAPLGRYDFVTLSAIAIQIILLATGLETRREALVIVMFHIAGTAMEIFKTATGSWVYPGPSVLHIAGVPLFTGFMYASVGSYLARVWRVFGFRFSRHPRWGHTAVLGAIIYLNFFIDHYGYDLRWLLFAAVAWLYGPAWVHYRVRRRYRRMPLLLGLLLVALFIWFAENLGTLTRTWIYAGQHAAWHMVPVWKIGSWLLLMIISYVMVSALHRRALRHDKGH